MGMTICQSDDLERMTEIMHRPEIKDLLKLRDDWHVGMMWKPDSIYLMIEEDGQALGFIWLDKTGEGMMSHVMLTKECRGAKALEALKGAINWMFLNTEHNYLMARPPFRHSYLLVKMLGWKDVRTEEDDIPVLGKLKRRVVRLDKADWFKRMLHRPFFVTGFPRSGTAWFSNLLTCTPALCLHEGSLLGPQIGLWLYEAPMRGLSDSMVVKTRLIDQNPESPVVLIKRDRSEAQASLAKFLDTDKANLDRTFDDLENRYLALESRPNTLVIDFKQSFTPAAIEAVWSHCLPDLPFDKTRAEFLRALNVQQSLPYIIKHGVPNPIDYGQALALPESPAKTLL